MKDLNYNIYPDNRRGKAEFIIRKRRYFGSNIEHWFQHTFPRTIYGMIS